MTSKIVLLNGYPAAGKTTLLAALREAGLRCPIMSKDDTKEILMHKTGLHNDQYGRQLNEAAIELLFDTMREHGRSGQSLLLEANFKPSFDQAIVEDIMRTYDIKTLQIMLTCDRDEMMRRDDERWRVGSRGAGHSRLDPAMARVMIDTVKPFDLPKSDIVTFDTTLPRPREYQQLVNRIVSFVA